jgi:hypothetical protein
MTSVRNLLFLSAICLLALTPAALADAPRFAVVDYPGAVATVALGINPAGDIVGAYTDALNINHGFLVRGGTITSFDYPGAAWTDADAIMPQGDILGQYGHNGATHGFLLKDGYFYPVEVSGATDKGGANSMPFGINPNGTIAGCYHQGPSSTPIAGTMYGFVQSEAGTTFDPLAGTMHTGINPSGDLTGYSTNGSSYVISASDGVRTWFTVPGATATRALGISATGAVVGWYKDQSTKVHGFLLRGGKATSIDADFPGVRETRATGINPAGDIVGFYIDGTGKHGFLLSRHGER